jgi:hypothetical protein
MAALVVKSCPKGVYTKIATNVTFGKVYGKDNTDSQVIKCTFVPTGDAAPIDDAKSFPLFTENVQRRDKIESSTAIDVYVNPPDAACIVLVAAG